MLDIVGNSSVQFFVFFFFRELDELFSGFIIKGFAFGAFFRLQFDDLAVEAEEVFFGDLVT